MRTRLFLTAIAITAAAACAGSPKQRAGGSYGGGTSSAGDSSAGYAAESPGSADYGGGHSHQPVDRTPAERPGLGTEWGETVRSEVRMRPFARASSSPFAAVAIHYNDADGVAAQTRYLGDYRLQPLRAYTPHGGISVALTDAHGNLLPGGQVSGRNLVVGQHGQRYNLVIENRTGGRYEVVASVDGLDVIDGKHGDLAKRGYILEPHGNLVIDGFRQSDSAVAAFRFGRVADSYAARTSGDRNVGVVGVALFAEAGSAWTTDELRRRDTANPFPGDRGYARPPGY
jgi:hypothetical protein